MKKLSYNDLTTYLQDTIKSNCDGAYALSIKNDTEESLIIINSLFYSLEEWIIYFKEKKELSSQIELDKVENDLFAIFFSTEA